MEKFEYLWDARSEGVSVGPFAVGDGQKMADELNGFLTPDSLKMRGVETGPWYVIRWEKIPVAAQKKLTRLYNS